tara:strand:+ start:34 stop:264 length:231 start_codon:yes stop_codon:yes gene_type:complete
MSNKIISHPRLIEQKEKELEEYEKQIEIKRIELFRDMRMLTHKSNNFDALRRKHTANIVLAFSVGILIGSAIMSLM